MESFHKSIWDSYETEGEWWQMIAVRISGRRACYTRPENKVERMTYPVITPSAAQGALGSVYTKPQMLWKITRIHVLAPIRYENWMSNEINHTRPLDISDERTQRRSRILRDVDYIIEAKAFSLNADEPAKHESIFNRRLLKGDYHHQPCLGLSQYHADVKPVDDIPVSPLIGEYELGTMFHSQNWGSGDRRFFECVMVDGVIDIPDLWGHCNELRATCQ